MATESSSSTAVRPRFAPPDPSLPKPWRALIDGNTGFLYFWNPVTKVTQYQRPQIQDDRGHEHNHDNDNGNEHCTDTNDDAEEQGQGSSLAKEDGKDNNNGAEKQHNASSPSSQPSVEVTLPTDKEEDLEGNFDDLLHASKEEEEENDKGTDKENDDGKPDKEEEGDGQLNDHYNVPSSSVQSPKECAPEVNSNDQDKSMQSSGDAPQVADATDSNASGFTVQTCNKREADDSVKSDSSKRPCYAPPDPSLPKPWRALIDGNTGYVYFWNPLTKVTQYERPVPPAVLPSSMEAMNSSKGPHPHTTNHLQDSSEPLYSSTKNGQQPSIFGRNLPSQVASSAESYRRQHEITVTGVSVPAPFMTFNTTGFPNEILQEINNAGFSVPTPIQAQSWPIALKGCDIVAIAKTGSGKTLGYLLPGFVLLKRFQNDPKIGPTMLVLSPTRELATQIQDEAVKFGQTSRISCTCLYGGAPKGPQLRELASGADAVVATPGRLNDILEMKRVSLSQVTYLVLDEADRMLDMGFEPQIRKIVAQVPAKRQTLMFTATWPKAVRRIAADLLKNPVQVNIGNTDELVANKSITQYVEVITPPEKGRRLEQILRSQEPGSKVIVFCSTKKMCDNLARKLTYQFGAAAIHGDKSQNERDTALNDFRNGKSPVLVATDVAARGLDVRDIRVVINYDFPTGVEDYVHRIGRTGRAGAKGEAYTFFCDQDSKYASDLVKILEGASQQVPPQLKQMTSYGGYSSRSSRW